MNPTLVLLVLCFSALTSGQNQQGQSLGFLSPQGNNNANPNQPQLGSPVVIVDTNNATISTPAIASNNSAVTDASSTSTSASTLTGSTSTQTGSTTTQTGYTSTQTGSTLTQTGSTLTQTGSTSTQTGSTSTQTGSSSTTVSSLIIISNQTNLVGSTVSKAASIVEPGNSSTSLTSDQSTTSATITSTTTRQTPTLAAPVQPALPLVQKPTLPLLPTNDTASLIFVAKGTYVKTSATEKACKQNQDCYNLREPDEWCPQPDSAKYGDKGCFCDHSRNVCAIQRQTEKGDEFSDCVDKSNSVCAGSKPVIRIQHKNKHKRLRA